MNLVYGSLFAGIGGLDLGLERAGWQCAWQVEIDPWCREVLAHHFPTAARFADVRDVGATQLASVDVIVGGFPCQDLSTAGKRVGITGARSGLWKEYARIIQEIKPKYVIIENVPGLRTSGAGMGVVLSDLAALGYDAQWQIIPACALGAPHRRERLFIVAYQRNLNRHHAKSRTTSDSNLPPFDGLEFVFKSGRDLANDQQFDRVHTWNGIQFDGTTRETTVRDASLRLACQPIVSRLDDGFSKKLVNAQLKGFGNAVVPTVGESVGRCVNDFHQRLIQ